MTQMLLYSPFAKLGTSQKKHKSGEQNWGKQKALELINLK
jgi:hypothetical protein